MASANIFYPSVNRFGDHDILKVKHRRKSAKFDRIFNIIVYTRWFY